MTPTTFKNPDALLDAIGQSLGTTDWLTIEQARINQFADATGDHQWIHTDPERAATQGPFGATIAHGFLTMSLCSYFLPRLIKITSTSMVINYGINKARFPAAVPVGSRLRAHGEVVSAEAVKGGVQAVTRITIELEGSAKPACVIDWVCRYLH